MHKIRREANRFNLRWHGAKTELRAICWRTAPALGKSKRAIADL
jgi:hypothetical protein